MEVGMKKTLIFVALLVFLCSSSFAAQVAQLSAGVNGGMYGGMYGIGGDVLVKMPVLGLKTTYLKLGLAITDSKNLTPTQQWKKFYPLTVDGVMFFSDRFYAGGGINYPLMVSDNETGNIGGQVYLGAELVKTAMGKVYTEAGYSVFRRNEGASFKGIQAVVGYRYDFGFVEETESQEMVVLGKKKAKRSVSGGVGMFAGMYGLRADMIFHNRDNSYIRTGLAMTNSQNLAPAQDARKFMLLNVDGLFYLNDEIYVGAGLNYPISVSDGDRAEFGGQGFVGYDRPMGGGTLYSELGYSMIRRWNQASFKGLHLMVGYRYDLASIAIGEKAIKVKVAPPVPAPVVKEPVKVIEDIFVVETVVEKDKPKQRPQPTVKAKKGVITHKLVWGDTLIGLARKYYGDWRYYADIAKLNKIKLPSRIYAGNTIKIDLNIKGKYGDK
jgi:LysM domain-containing protein